ncbi:MAG: BsaA family SipW-dependent biofilm matrix protein [Clostridiales bacterium]|nr:BsaA family SipW-dependent biofilm matrix protein [Clostridiales bacterium]
MKNGLKGKKKGRLIALAGFLALAVLGGTYAYWSQTSQVDNPFDTGQYGSTIREDFSPADGENWQPGVTVDKAVKAVNTGDVDLIVRARLDEKWVYKGQSAPYKDSAAAVGGYNVYATSQNNATDGLTALDGSVVTKTFSSSTKWIPGGDGWYYYTVNLKGGESSEAWLSAVTLLSDADMGDIVTKKYVSVSADANEASWVWVEYTGDMPKYIGADKVLHNKTETSYASGRMGYSQSDYTLTVTVQTVQATAEAVNDAFGGGSAFALAGTSWTLK